MMPRTSSWAPSQEHQQHCEDFNGGSGASIPSLQPGSGCSCSPEEETAASCLALNVGACGLDDKCEDADKQDPLDDPNFNWYTSDLYHTCLQIGEYNAYFDKLEGEELWDVDVDVDGDVAVGDALYPITEDELEDESSTSNINISVSFSISRNDSCDSHCESYYSYCSYRLVGDTIRKDGTVVGDGQCAGSSSEVGTPVFSRTSSLSDGENIDFPQQQIDAEQLRADYYEQLRKLQEAVSQKGLPNAAAGDTSDGVAVAELQVVDTSKILMGTGNVDDKDLPLQEQAIASTHPAGTATVPHEDRTVASSMISNEQIHHAAKPALSQQPHRGTSPRPALAASAAVDTDNTPVSAFEATTPAEQLQQITAATPSFTSDLYIMSATTTSGRRGVLASFIGYDGGEEKRNVDDAAPHDVPAGTADAVVQLLKTPTRETATGSDNLNASTGSEAAVDTASKVG
ncbi:unnamed protein product [Amoebophrya sp. A120]|nr:unnamed protein product [Amoebophrya sp. A120]|eukprot:GSA120T00006805001.1